MERNFFVLVVEQGGIEFDRIAGGGAVMFDDRPVRKCLNNGLAAISYLRKRRMA